MAGSPFRKTLPELVRTTFLWPKVSERISPETGNFR